MGKQARKEDLKGTGRTLSADETKIYNRIMSRLYASDDFDLQDNLNRVMTGIIENNKTFQDITHFERYLKSCLKKPKVIIHQDIDVEQNMSFDIASTEIEGINTELLNDIADRLNHADIDSEEMTGNEISDFYKQDITDYDIDGEKAGFKRDNIDFTEIENLNYRSFENHKSWDLVKHIVRALPTGLKRKVFVKRYVFEYTQTEIADKCNIDQMQVSRLLQDIDRRLLNMDLKQLVNEKWYCGTGHTKSQVWRVYPDSLPDVNVIPLKKIRYEKNQDVINVQRIRFKESSERAAKVNEYLLNIGIPVETNGVPYPVIDYSNLDNSLTGFKAVKKGIDFDRPKLIDGTVKIDHRYSDATCHHAAMRSHYTDKSREPEFDRLPINGTQLI